MMKGLRCDVCLVAEAKGKNRAACSAAPSAAAKLHVVKRDGPLQGTNQRLVLSNAFLVKFL
jgi:hypothetical protein